WFTKAAGQSGTNPQRGSHRRPPADEKRNLRAELLREEARSKQMKNIMKRMIAGAVALSLATVTLKAQNAPDTIVINLTESSKVVLTVGDSTDLQVLRDYDFQ